MILIIYYKENVITYSYIKWNDDQKLSLTIVNPVHACFIFVTMTKAEKTEESEGDA